MRAIGLSDLDIATRAVMAAPKEYWAAMAQQLIEDAHVADRWRKHFGTVHPDGGTGSLYAQAALGRTGSSSACTAQYCAAMSVVLHALQVWRARGDPPTHHNT